MRRRVPGNRIRRPVIKSAQQPSPKTRQVFQQSPQRPYPADERDGGGKIIGLASTIQAHKRRRRVLDNDPLIARYAHTPKREPDTPPLIRRVQ